MCQKFIAILLLSFLSATALRAQVVECDQYKELMSAGDQAVKDDKLQRAIQDYNMAAINCSENSAKAYEKVHDVFEKINGINIAQKKILGSMYFYKDKYALAVNRIGVNNELRWGYINKKGVAQFDGFIYSTATIFNEKTESAAVTLPLYEGLDLNLTLYDNDTYTIQNNKLDLSNKKIVALPKIVLPKLKNIQRVDLSNNLLQSAPEVLYGYDSLWELDLGSNSIAELSPQIGNWKKAEVIYLNNNNLSAIPNEIKNWNAVKSLYLNNNFLSSLPTEIGDLKNMYSLYIYENKLRTIPAEIANATALKILNLENNELETIPEEIGKLKKLNTLLLKNNKLKTIPTSINKLSELRTLHLARNENIILPTNLFTAQFPVEVLDISYCNLKKIPSGLETLLKIKTLDLSNNPIGTMPILNAQRLENLNLSNCDLAQYPMEVEKCYSNLNTLDVSKNKIDSLPPCIVCMQKLNYLDASNNLFEKIPDALLKLKELTSLKISHNKIESIPLNMAHLAMLSGLDVSHNKITDVPPTFINMANLTQLNLSENKIEVLPTLLAQLPKLSELTMDNCGMKYIFTSPPTLDTAINKRARATRNKRNPSTKNNLAVSDTQETDLENVESNEDSEADTTDIEIKTAQKKISRRERIALRSQRKEAIQDSIEISKQTDSMITHNLRNISLSHNELTDVGAIINGSTMLEHLNLSHNQLSNIPSENQQIKKLNETLRSLNLSKNNFELIPNSWQGFTYLKSLDISDNPIKKVRTDFLFSLSSLNELNLRNCNLDELKVENPTRIAFLEEVNISENLIEELPSNIFKIHRLRKITAQNCRFTTIPAEISQCNSLHYFDASGNKLKKLDENLFGTTSNISTLKLANCNLTAFPQTILSLDILGHLDLSNNQIEEIPFAILDMVFPASKTDEIAALILTGNPLSEKSKSVLQQFRDTHPQVNVQFED